MRLTARAFVLLFFLGGPASVEAKVAVEIDLSTQTMHVRAADGTYTWPVSTARSGFSTPRGSYRPTHLKRIHYSRKYHMSPMPYSIFFNGGYAIHGTYETSYLGHPASHGCVRLAPGHAARLFEMVEAQGAAITIIGNPPRSGIRQRALLKSQGTTPTRGRASDPPRSYDAARSFWTTTDD
jgi:hypothetical protein